MIKAARAAKVPFAWFTADEEFGQNPGLCDYLQTNHIPYVMAVPKNTRFTDTAGTTRQCNELARRLRPNAWQRRACGIGAKGFRVYDWALTDSADPDHQYLTRRSIDNGELAFYHCYNPARAGFGDLVLVAGARWPIEECFGSGKNEVGLDNYQVRTWNAWHRHITLAMLAQTYLAVTAQQTKKGDLRQPNNRTHPNHEPNHPSTAVLSHSPSLKSADSSTSPTATNTPSTTACAGRSGAGSTKPRPAGPMSGATSDSRS